MIDGEYKKILKQYHKLSDRHILVAETDMPYSDVLKIVVLSDKIRKAGNELVGLMRKNYDQLFRTKRYRKLLSLYGNTGDKAKRKILANQLNKMQKSYNVTWDHCRKSMIPIGKKYGVDAVFALTKAEDIWRGMDRSKRASNPQNYNDDGTVKKGCKTWKYSNHYKKLRARHAELCRINAVNRKLAINEDVNHLRSLGDVFVTEPKNTSKLMKRAMETTKNDKGRFNRKKRFGKSIKNRCPGGFQSNVEKKFKATGGTYIEVPNNYRASQYDHTADDYIKKKLSDRFFKLRDGTEVQRDWYSSFLLYCYDPMTHDIDKNKCNAKFEEQYNREKALITWINANKLKILNSGIKIA
uniref:hypothetical protein n=1 Tax=Eubacterium cellulosolvens TaxID=29322 RepID=UPI0004869F84|nr:hypothetical protein [[Eubacterium] cellulosolvens]